MTGDLDTTETARAAAANALAQALDAIPEDLASQEQLADEAILRAEADDLKVDKIGDDDIVITDPAKGVVLTSPNGGLWRLTITDDGHDESNPVIA